MKEENTWRTPYRENLYPFEFTGELCELTAGKIQQDTSQGKGRIPVLWGIKCLGRALVGQLCDGNTSTNRAEEKRIKVFGGKPEGKRPLLRTAKR